MIDQQTFLHHKDAKINGSIYVSDKKILTSEAQI